MAKARYTEVKNIRLTPKMHAQIKDMPGGANEFIRDAIQEKIDRAEIISVEPELIKALKRLAETCIATYADKEHQSIYRDVQRAFEVIAKAEGI